MSMTTTIMPIHFDLIYDKLSSTFNHISILTLTQNNIPRVVLVISQPKSTTPSPIITRDDVVSKAKNKQVHHIIHMTHALHFGIRCSEAMLVHGRFVKVNLSIRM